jgi:hypothetical protein
MEDQRCQTQEIGETRETSKTRMVIFGISVEKYTAEK